MLFFVCDSRFRCKIDGLAKWINSAAFFPLFLLDRQQTTLAGIKTVNDFTAHDAKFSSGKQPK